MSWPIFNLKLNNWWACGKFSLLVTNIRGKLLQLASSLRSLPLELKIGWGNCDDQNFKAFVCDQVFEAKRPLLSTPLPTQINAISPTHNRLIGNFSSSTAETDTLIKRPKIEKRKFSDWKSDYQNLSRKDNDLDSTLYPTQPHLTGLNLT